MNKKQDFNKEEITLKFLETKLGSFGEPKVPVTLKSKLLDAIPQKPHKQSAVHFISQRFGIWGLGTSAALVVVFVLIIMLNLGPSVPSTGKNKVTNTYPNDINATFIEDINLVYYSPERLNFEKAGLFLSK